MHIFAKHLNLIITYTRESTILTKIKERMFCHIVHNTSNILVTLESFHFI